MTDIYAMSPDEAEERRGDIESLLDPVTRKRGYTAETVIDRVKSGDSTMWSINDLGAVGVTDFVQRTTERVLWVSWLAGTDMVTWLDDWLLKLDELAAWSNCDAIEFQGRKGWERTPKVSADYTQLMTLHRKEL